MLADTIRRLLRRNAKANLSKVLTKTHPSDIARVLTLLSPTDRLAVFRMLPNHEYAAEVLSEAEPHLREELIPQLPLDQVAELLQKMASDDAAVVLSELPEDLRESVLAKMKAADSEELNELLSYTENTAGRIMSPDFLSLEEHVSAKDAQKEIRRAAEAEMVFYVYVTDPDGKLAGVVSLRDLVVVPPDTMLSAIMTREVVKVTPEVDQEDVAKLVAQYNLLAVPVIDVEGRMIGIVTVDDIVDVIRDEATEDILRMAGTSHEEITSFSILRATRMRLPWLLAAFVGGILAYFIIGRFEETLSRVVLLAAFLPVILGMGGNIGTQSSAITVRGLATGRIQLNQFWRVVGKELGVGVLMGSVYAVILFAVAYFISNTGDTTNPLLLGVAVAAAIVANMTIAATLGVLLPLSFHRMRFDPAVASGPFVTTSIDVIGVTVYFGIASLILL